MTMTVQFQNPAMLSGARVRPPHLKLFYGSHAEITLECVDRSMRPVDLESRGLETWEAVLRPAPGSQDELASCTMGADAAKGGALSLSMGLQTVELYRFCAGRGPSPCLLYVVGKSADGRTVVAFNVPVTVESGAEHCGRRPVDVSTALMEELQLGAAEGRMFRHLAAQLRAEMDDARQQMSEMVDTAARQLEDRLYALCRSAQESLLQAQLAAASAAGHDASADTSRIAAAASASTARSAQFPQVPDLELPEADREDGWFEVASVAPIAQVLVKSGGMELDVTAQCRIELHRSRSLTRVQLPRPYMYSAVTVRFAQGYGGLSPYQEYLAAGGVDNYGEWYSRITVKPEEAPMDGGFYARKDGQWVDVKEMLEKECGGCCGCDGQGQGGSQEPQPSAGLSAGDMVLGYVPYSIAGDVSRASAIPWEAFGEAVRQGFMEASEPQATTREFTVSPGSYVVALVPYGRRLSAKIDDGLGNAVPFNGVNEYAAFGASGERVMYDGSLYLLYAELQFVTATRTVSVIGG